MGRAGQKRSPLSHTRPSTISHRPDAAGGGLGGDAAARRLGDGVAAPISAAISEAGPCGGAVRVARAGAWVGGRGGPKSGFCPRVRGRLSERPPPPFACPPTFFLLGTAFTNPNPMEQQPLPPPPNQTPTADSNRVPPRLERPLRLPLRPAGAGARLLPVVFRPVRIHTRWQPCQWRLLSLSFSTLLNRRHHLQLHQIKQIPDSTPAAAGPGLLHQGDHQQHRVPVATVGGV